METSGKGSGINKKTHKGPFIKNCPCAPGAVSCGYLNANLQTGCIYRCSYCILQEYLASMEPVLFRNWRQVIPEVERLSVSTPHPRLGTGELTDSLALEPMIPLASPLLDIFAGFPTVVFEFKTKSAQVQNLLARKRPPENIVVSWSLNPNILAASEEKHAPALESRLQALAAVQQKGYRVAIHFDPLILFPGWESHYLELIRAIARILNPGRLAWWSLGALRFTASMRSRILAGGKTMIFHGELLPGFDGKFRYLKPMRIDLFRTIRKMIEETISKDLPLYLCMEDEETWSEVFPGCSTDSCEINRRLYESVFA